MSKAVKEVTDVPKVDASLLAAVDGFLISGVNGFDLEIHLKTRPVERMFGALCGATSQSEEISETPAVANAGIDPRPVAKTTVAGNVVCMPEIGPVHPAPKPWLPLGILSATRPQKSIPVPQSYVVNPLF